VNLAIGLPGSRPLGFEATTTLDEMLNEVIPWVEKALADGLI
jgi:UDP-glucose 4-epimerase